MVIVETAYDYASITIKLRIKSSKTRSTLAFDLVFLNCNRTNYENPTP